MKMFLRMAPFFRTVNTGIFVSSSPWGLDSFLSAMDGPGLAFLSFFLSWVLEREGKSKKSGYCRFCFSGVQAFKKLNSIEFPQREKDLLGEKWRN
jgi:hypothetical protein